MRGKSVLKNIIRVALSNIIALLAGVGVGLLLPKLLEVEDYGWYKTFTLYSNYLGFASVGLIDGIILTYGGMEYDGLDKPLFRSYFWWYTLLNGFFVIFLVVISFITDSEYSFILIALALYLIIGNTTGFFQQISQITQRFKEFSYRKILSSILKIFNVGCLFVWIVIGHKSSYKVYLSIFLFTEFFLTAWYLYTYREMIVGSRIPINKTKPAIIKLCKSGFPLLFANLCASLILSLDRQFVRLFFDTLTYAKYAFAYNMLSLVTVTTSAISTVLYPTLKTVEKNDMKKYYGTLIGIILVSVSCAITIYFPLCVFVRWFLPKYTESLPIFRIVFPGLIISSAITVVMHNYYKSEGKSSLYFLKSVMVLIVSAIANSIAYIIFRTTASISIASIITMIFWYFYVERYFVKEYNFNASRNLAYILCIMTLFYVVTSLDNYWISGLLYIIGFVGLSLTLQKKVCMRISNALTKKNVR